MTLHRLNKKLHRGNRDFLINFLNDIEEINNAIEPELKLDDEELYFFRNAVWRLHRRTSRDYSNMKTAINELIILRENLKLPLDSKPSI